MFASLRNSAVPTCIAISLAFAGDGFAQPNKHKPEAFTGIEVTERLDGDLPLDLGFRDDRGRDVRLGDYFDGTKPVVLSMNYSDCPMLCNLQLNGLFDSMKELSLRPGEDFEFVSVSINPLETTDRARIAKNGYVRELNDPGAAKGMHFLVGSKANIDALARAVGFSYNYIAEQKHYAHPAVLEICTPTGRISRYLYGVEFPVRDLRLSLVEASEGKIGTTMDQILLVCLHFNPEEGRYTPFAVNLMKLAGGLTVFIGAILIVPYWFMRSPSTRRSKSGEGSDKKNVGAEPDDRESDSSAADAPDAQA